jgi:hypothetical protein
MRGEPIREHAREGRPGTRPSPDICVGHAEGRRRTPPSLSLRSHNQSPPLSGRRASEFFRVGVLRDQRALEGLQPMEVHSEVVVDSRSIM